MNKNDIGSNISRAIKEGKWLNIEYKNRYNICTVFWIAINDIDCSNRTLKVWMFNNNEKMDILESPNISFDNIQSATVIEFTSYQRPDSLIEKIESNLKQYQWLKYDHYNNNILNYYIECSILDNDPVQKSYTCINGIDINKLKKNSTLPLNESQSFQIISIIYEFNIKKVYNKFFTLAINRLSIDKDNKKYVVCYYILSYNPKEKTLVLDPTLRFNSRFMVDGRPCSLHKYVPMDLDEFARTFEENQTDYENMIIHQCNGEKINTMPDMMILEREISVDLLSTISEIEYQYEENCLSMPLKSFFGNTSKIINRGRKKKDSTVIIYNNLINLNQMRVVYNSLNHPVTYVQGPPGTGKTQTILNVIMSAFFNNKTVLVCSSNNKPVDGIIEKLKFTYNGKEIPFPFLRLGKYEEVEGAIKKIIRFLDIAETINEENLVKEIEGKRNSMIMDIDTDSSIMDININDDGTVTDVHTLEEVMETMKEKIIDKQQEFVELLSQYEKRLQLNSKKQKDIENIPEITENDLLNSVVVWKDNALFQKYFYYRSLQIIKSLKKPRYKELRETCKKKGDERIRTFNDYCSEKKYMKRLLKIFPIILTTNISSRRLGPPDLKFDLVIMDEAGQCNIASSLIPITKANNLLLVGDPNQLRPVILIEEKTNEALMEKYKVPPQYNYIKYSILDVMTFTDKISKYILLNYHYRCGKSIIRFSNQRYYKGELNLSKIKDEGSLELLTVENNNVVNRNEAYDEAKEIINYIKRNKVEDAYIVTPFINQKELINSLLKEEKLDGTIQCGTIHSLQGAEKNTIIFSMAISKKTSARTFEWIKNNYEMINVAVTRAKKRLIIASDTVVVDKLSDKTDDIYQLIQYVKNNGKIKVPPNESPMVEIGYSNGSRAENEFYNTIRHFCTCYPKFSAERNVKIYKLVPGNEQENHRRYGELELDLVIYAFLNNNGEKRPVIAFEVNGGEHLGNHKREQSDQYKREICEKHLIKLIFISNNFVKAYLSIMDIISHTTNDFNAT
ncbi:hypothetical protein PIROE2DRAFT_60642 [Piromyces sp. E2]|nr:hypothetical protein PIROE2DRAFT_60642 [Piromyces sp. E2]|eukprot:OUM64502.1 hypothetical protein PIROE2DRAFT_60642 [Piromyces sp. E2]